jgi:hypothetical protein
MKLKIYQDSTNYTCQVIKLPSKIPIKGLDNLVHVSVQGNSCLISKDSPEDVLYLYFPCESQISHDFLCMNNLYREATLNSDSTQKGFFEENRRVKALKLRGIISSGFVIPITSLQSITSELWTLRVGDEFNEFDGVEICKKYIKRSNPGKTGFSNPRTKMLDEIVNSKMVPEHPDTSHLLKNIHKLSADDHVVITYKLHGTSARTYNTLVKRKLSWKDRWAKRFGVKVVEDTYETVACSRRVVKSVGFEQLPNKNHFFTSGDLWSEWAKKNLEGKLNKGEAVYYELIGKTYSGEAIQHGYSYGFNEPMCYVYRITNINPDGIEVDLSWEQTIKRAEQLGLKVCPVFFNGKFGDFLVDRTGEAISSDLEQLTELAFSKILERNSILDASVPEEGFCVRVEGTYPKAEIYKIKSKKFLEYETKALDKEVVNIEENESQSTGESISESNM